MLNTEQIKENYSKYFEMAKKYNFFTDSLADVLGENFISAPASTQVDYNNAFEGGLCDHILRVTRTALTINKGLPEDLKIDMGKIIKVGFLHQIGKTNLFKKLASVWHNERGIMYEFNNDMISMSVSERSIFMIQKAGIPLDEIEHQAILNYNKPNDDKQAKLHTNLLGVLIRHANELSVIEEQMKLKK